MNEIIRLKKIMDLYKRGDIDDDQFMFKLFEIFDIYGENNTKVV